MPQFNNHSAVLITDVYTSQIIGSTLYTYFNGPLEKLFTLQSNIIPKFRIITIDACDVQQTSSVSLWEKPAALMNALQSTTVSSKIFYESFCLGHNLRLQNVIVEFADVDIGI